MKIIKCPFVDFLPSRLCVHARVALRVSQQLPGSSLASPRFGAAAQFGMHRDSYNLANWNGAGFGLNLS